VIFWRRSEEIGLHILWTVLLGVIAFLWILQAIEIARGVQSLPNLSDARLIEDSRCPSVSILVTARDEAVKLPGALATLLGEDYPNYEVVAVDDRSADATGSILETAAGTNSRVKWVRVEALPEGWLGKPHGLQQAYEHATGEWLVFTDADVYFAPDVLRRALALALANGWDHLTLLGRVEMYGFFEKIAMTFFGFLFVMGSRPWLARDPQSSGYIGVGAFQLVRRASYEAMGTHRRLRMEVVDDMKLGKLMKQSGARSGVAKAGDRVSVHWHDGVRNIVRGTTKNFFATVEYRLSAAIGRIAGLLLMFVVPVVALFFARGWTLAFGAIAAALPAMVEAGAALEFGESPFWGLSHPIGALIFVWMLARSTAVTLWQGGIVWRGTFYPLGELRKGMA
jgi:glycosyltransferase involved in cell wall biosynthesis